MLIEVESMIFLLLFQIILILFTFKCKYASYFQSSIQIYFLYRNWIAIHKWIQNEAQVHNTFISFLTL